MYEFWVRFAGLPIWIGSKHKEHMKKFMKMYEITPSKEDWNCYEAWSDKAGFSADKPLMISEEQFREMKNLCGYDGQKEERFMAEYIEALAIYREIANRILYEDILLFHGSALSIDGEGYLFAAPSGTGKSTHAELWRKLYGDRVTMINDDKPLIRVEEEGDVTVFGTPYCGKTGLNTNQSVCLKGIIVLYQAKENVIKRLSVQEAFPYLFYQTYRNEESEFGMRRTIELVHALAQIPVYHMGCTISEEAAEMAYNALKGGL